MASIREHRAELAGFGTRALEIEGDGPATLLLHGFSDSADTWRALLREFARLGRRALALDMPGFGQAARLRRDEAILPQLDAFAAAAIEHEAERSATGEVLVAGNSLGGCVAMRAAERDELPVAGLIPIAPAGLEMARWISIIEGEVLLRWLLRTPFPVPELVVREIVGRAYLTMAFAHPRNVDPTVVASFTRHVRTRRDAVRILATGHRVVGELRDPFRLDRINCPVLLVWGEQDRMVFATGADRVLREVPGARIEMIEHCGHCPQIEAPERLAELLTAFPPALAEAA